MTRWHGTWWRRHQKVVRELRGICKPTRRGAGRCIPRRMCAGGAGQAPGLRGAEMGDSACSCDSVSGVSGHFRG